MKQNCKITIKEQIRLLKKYYPCGSLEFIKHRGFIWIGLLKSSPLGDFYKIKIIYELGSSPEVFVLEPEKLSLPISAEKLPHVYSNTKQKLCLYYPANEEWNTSKMIASSIMPWTIEWLYHYELWLITGKWLGGGRHPQPSEGK